MEKSMLPLRGERTPPAVRPRGPLRQAQQGGEAMKGLGRAKPVVRLGTRVAILVVALGLVAATAAAQEGGGAPSDALGDGTELIYTNCYENVAGFRLPLSLLSDLAESDLPVGFSYRTFDPAGTIGQLNVVGLDCDQGGHGVTDVLLNVLVNTPDEFRAGRPTALRVRTYTNTPKSRARHGLYCFGNVTALSDVQASVEIHPTTGARHGRVVVADGAGSIELRTTTNSAPREIAPATLQHFTVEDGEVHGRIEWGSSDPGISEPVAEATLLLNGATYIGVGGQHVFPPEGAPATFFHRGLTSCSPGLDWND